MGIKLRRSGLAASTLTTEPPYGSKSGLLLWLRLTCLSLQSVVELSSSQHLTSGHSEVLQSSPTKRGDALVQEEEWLTSSLHVEFAGGCGSCTVAHNPLLECTEMPEGSAFGCPAEKMALFLLKVCCFYRCTPGRAQSPL